MKDSQLYLLISMMFIAVVNIINDIAWVSLGMAIMFIFGSYYFKKEES